MQESEFSNPVIQRETSALARVLEQARALQSRQGLSAREALAMALANVRRAKRLTPSGDLADTQPIQVPLPAAACLDARLPRDREPSIEEIREAWNECIEQSWALAGGP
jgi:hypothetical protein